MMPGVKDIQISSELKTMLDRHYANQKLVELYDLDSPWSPDREFYLQLAAPTRQSVLDLGCGTGLICDAYAAKGHDVTGVDPSKAMLDVARRKPFGDKIDWVESTSQDYRSDKLFDLIIMTGHAFQVLIDDSDILETFSAMGRQLKETGLIVFESRNPRIDWSQTWDYDIDLKLPDCIVTESRRFKQRIKDRLSFELRYQFPNETLVSMSELRFLSMGDIVNFLSASGLTVEQILGDWDGALFNESTSQEMIFKVTK